MGEVKLGMTSPYQSDFCEVFHKEHWLLTSSLGFFDLPDQ